MRLRGALLQCCIVFVLNNYIYSTYNIHMLYEQIRHAGTIRRLYRIKHQLARRGGPDLGTRLGYPKYSKQFYRVRSLLVRERVINRRGEFIQSLPNMHMAKMPLLVEGDQIRVLGDRVPYCLFLALACGAPARAGSLAEELRLSRKAVYDALARMKKARLVSMSGPVAAASDGPARRWLEEYLDLLAVWIDASEDASVLFNAIPACVGGPLARYLLDYEPGRPMGLADMHIFTPGPFFDLVRSTTGKSRYFRHYPREVKISAAHGGRVEWVGGVPYSKDAGEVLG